VTDVVDLTQDFEASHRALRGEGGLVPVERDLVSVIGPQAAEFLQGQLSQDVGEILSGTSRCSFLLQPTGKVDAWFRVGPISDGFAIDVAGGFGEAVKARLERFKLRTKVDIEVRTDLWPQRAVRGERVEGSTVDILRPAVEGLQYVEPEGLPKVSLDAYETVRIECGVPRMGAELTESTIPAEAGQWVIDQSVSFTKGCFTGQELVARIDSRGGNVPRHLRGLVIEDAVPPVGASVVVDGSDVGVLTSVGRSPESRGAVALAYIARKVDTPADAVVTWAGGRAPARVEPIPLV
jgi:folate-binding protein YgfZ